MRKILRLLTGGCLGLLAVALGSTGAAAQPRAYVTNEFSNNVSVIDTTTNTVIRTLNVGGGPRPVEVTPNGRFAYVANHGANPNTVSVIERTADAVVATITVGTGPTRVGFSINSACAYAVNEGSNNISVIDTSSMTVVATVDTGLAPRPGAITPHGENAVLLNQLSNDVWVYDLTEPCNPGPPVAKIPVGMSPLLALITTDGQYLYVLGNRSTIVVIDLMNLAVLTTVPVGRPSGGDINQNGHFLYVTSSVSNNVSVIATAPGSPTFNTVVATIPIENGPAGGAFRPDGSLFVLANANSQLLAIDTDPQSPTYNTVVASLTLTGLTDDDRGGFTQDGGTLYVTNRLSNAVRVIDVAAFQVTGSIPVGTNPTHLAITPF